MTELIVGTHQSDTHQKALRINLDPRWYEFRRIAARDDSWESMVPTDVAELIKRRAYFGYVRPGRD